MIYFKEFQVIVIIKSIWKIIDVTYERIYVYASSSG